MQKSRHFCIVCVGTNVCGAMVLSSRSSESAEREWPLVSICCGSCGLVQSPHRASDWSFLQVFYIHCKREYNMSNVLFCGAKPVNICPCSTYKIVLLSASPLSSSTPKLHCLARPHLLLLSYFIPLPSFPLHVISPPPLSLSFHFLSSFSLSLRGQERCARLSWQQRWEDKMEQSSLAWPLLQEKIWCVNIFNILLENENFPD